MTEVLQLLKGSNANLDLYQAADGEVVIGLEDARPRVGMAGVVGGHKLAMLSDVTVGAVQVPTLNGGWINYGAGYRGAEYRVDPQGRVTIEGMVQAPSGSSTTLTLFTLQTGYRPPAQLVFTCMGAGGPFRVDVLPDGSVNLTGANVVFASLSGVSFFTS